MSDVDQALVDAAVNVMLKRDPKLLEATANYLARVESTPVEAPRKMTPEQVRAEIERLSGRAPLTADEQRDIDRDGEAVRLAEEYRQAVAKREREEATARAREIFRSIQPGLETGG